MLGHRPFDPMFHGDEFCAKDGGLNSRLPLGNQLDKSQVAEDQDTGARTASTLATSMVTIAHHADVNLLPKGFRHVKRNSFRDIAIELGPVALGKVTLINERIGRVKDESSIMPVSYTHLTLPTKA